MKHFLGPCFTGIIGGRVNDVAKINAILLRPEKNELITGTFPLVFFCNVVDFLYPSSNKGAPVIAVVLQNVLLGRLEQPYPIVGIETALGLSDSVDSKDAGYQKQENAANYFHRNQVGEYISEWKKIVWKKIFRKGIRNSARVE